MGAWDRWPHGGEHGRSSSSGEAFGWGAWEGEGWGDARGGGGWGRRRTAWAEGGSGDDWGWPSDRADGAEGHAAQSWREAWGTTDGAASADDQADVQADGAASADEDWGGWGGWGGGWGDDWEWSSDQADGAASADEDELPLWIAHHDLVLSPRAAEEPSPRFTLLFFHGGSSGPADVFYYVPHLFGRVRPHDVRVVAPCSPRRRLSWGGQSCNCWYEYTTDCLWQGGEQDAVSWAHFTEQRRRLLRLLEDEHRRLPPGGRIVLGGLSQGAALALDLVLHAPEHVDSIAGCFCSRGMMQCETLWDLPEDNIQRRAGSCLVHVFHGRSDAIVPWRAARRSYQWLVSQGFDVNFHTRKWVSHSSDCEEEYQEVASFAARAWRSAEP